MKPYYKQALIFFLLIIGVFYLLYLTHFKTPLNWILIILTIIFIYFFVDSFIDIYAGMPIDHYLKNKKFNTYNNEGLKITSPLRENYEYITWKSMEAIFLSNRPPNEGEYHNFEYIFILNKEPIVTNFEKQSWYNKIQIFPTRKKKGLPYITMNDYWHKDFQTIAPAIEKYLIVEYPIANNNLKFGNEIHPKNNKLVFKEKNIKQFGFYKIYDKNNTIMDKMLNEYRLQAK